MNIGINPLKIRLVINTMAITVDFNIIVVTLLEEELNYKVLIRANGTAPLTNPDTKSISN